MFPITLKGWFNKVVRGYPYNEKTAFLLDHTYRPGPRFLSTLQKSPPRAESSPDRWKLPKMKIAKCAPTKRDLFALPGQP